MVNNLHIILGHQSTGEGEAEMHEGREVTSLVESKLKPAYWHLWELIWGVSAIAVSQTKNSL